MIESHDLARDSLVEFLRGEGHEVHEAINVFAGLRLVREIPFDVVLTDVMLPGPDGVMMLRRLREVLPGSKLIVMTVETGAETLSAITGLGAQYVRKPILFDDLLMVL